MSANAEEIRRQAEATCSAALTRLDDRRAAEREKRQKDYLFTRAVLDAVEIDNHVEEEKKQWGMVAHTDVNIPDLPIPESLSQVVNIEQLKSEQRDKTQAKGRRNWQKWDDVYPYARGANPELRRFPCPTLEGRGLQDLLQERELVSLPQAWDLRIAFMYLELDRLELSIKYAELALRCVDPEKLRFDPNSKDEAKDIYPSTRVLLPLQQDACHVLFESYCQMAHSKRVALNHELFDQAATGMRRWLDMVQWSKEALEEIDLSIQLIRSFSGPRHLKDQAKICMEGESCLMESLHAEVLQVRVQRDSANGAIRTLQTLYYQRKQLDEFMQLSSSEASCYTRSL